MQLPAESCEITLDLGIFMLYVVGRLPVFTSLLGLCSFIYTHVFFVGISQSYISQWLLQQGLEMSDSKRRAFYRWYLLERNSPGEHGV